MRVLITGANGMQGKATKQRFKDETVICTDINELDITKFADVQRLLKSERPDVVINCAAFNAVYAAEKYREQEAYKVNCLGPENLAKACAEVGSILVQISTNYVFDGNIPTDMIYKETDEKIPGTVYGRTKLSGENAIKKYTTMYYIFRTEWLFGDGTNFVQIMINNGREEEKIKVPCDQFGSPTYAVDLADIIYQALQKKIPMGIYHATNIGFTNLVDFTREIYKRAKIPCEIIPVTSDEFERTAQRPLNSMLAKGKILDEGIIIPNWQNALCRYIYKDLKLT